MGPNGKSKADKQTAWRLSIETSAVLKSLNDHALGKKPLKNSQIRAAQILLAKTMPDLRATEHSGEVTGVQSIHINL